MNKKCILSIKKRETYSYALWPLLSECDQKNINLMLGFKQSIVRVLRFPPPFPILLVLQTAIVICHGNALGLKQLLCLQIRCPLVTARIRNCFQTRRNKDTDIFRIVKWCLKVTFCKYNLGSIYNKRK